MRSARTEKLEGQSLLIPEVESPTLTAPKKNDTDSSPEMDNLIAETKRDINNTAAHLEQFEKCVFRVRKLQTGVPIARSVLYMSCLYTTV